MGSEENSMPMDDASFSNEAPMDPNQMDMNQDIDMMGQNNDMMGGESPMDGDMGGENTMPEQDDSTMGIIDQLSSEDKDAVRAYAESLLKKTESQPNDNEEPMSDGLNMEAPVGGNMSESVIFTKKQLNMIKENFNKDDETENKPLNKKNKKNISKKSPFNAPKFN